MVTSMNRNSLIAGVKVLKTNVFFCLFIVCFLDTICKIGLKKNLLATLCQYAGPVRTYVFIGFTYASSDPGSICLVHPWLSAGDLCLVPVLMLGSRALWPQRVHHRVSISASVSLQHPVTAGAYDATNRHHWSFPVQTSLAHVTLISQPVNKNAHMLLQ